MLSRSVVLFLSLVSVASAVTPPTPEPVKQGQQQKQGQIQGQVAKGGNAEQSQSNSNVVNSSGGAGGSANQSQAANNEGNSFSTSSVYKDRLQAPSISAPAVYASGPCSSGKSLGLAVPGGGISGGKTVTDPLCDRREVARVLAPLNPALALRVLCADPYVAAVATGDDCVYVPVARTQTAPEVDPSLYATHEEVQRAFKQSQSK